MAHPGINLFTNDKINMLFNNLIFYENIYFLSFFLSLLGKH